MPKKNRSAQKRPQNDPKTTKKAIPKDKTTREPNQDDFKTVLDPPKVPDHKYLRTPRAPFGRPDRHQNGTKNDPKSKRKIKSQQKPIQDDLGPVLGRSWVVLGVILGLWNRSKHYACRCFVNIHFFDVKTIRRRSWDQLWPTKAPK